VPARGGIHRLALGPVVGHTDEASSRIWIQVFDDPANYALRVHGAGLYPFASTEAGPPEFGTALALATGLRSDWRYRYSVLRHGRFVPRATGSFRTMPSPGSLANLLFCALSCNSDQADGALLEFGQFVERAKPHFVVMMGDQVYIDDDSPNVFNEHLDSPPAVRRKALVAKYQRNWSREPVRKLLANTPTYMMWDDHEIRDGWGSLASDSPTLAARYARGANIFRKCNAYFEDARDVYWHFQACRNPLATPGQAFPNYIDAPPGPGERRALPYAFRCGRLALVMLDSRGARDAFRPELPILGAEQWQFLTQLRDTLPADIDALAVMTPTPIASLDPAGQTLKLMGGRTDDVEAFKRGDEDALLHPHGSEDFDQLLLAAAGARLTRVTGSAVNLGNFKLSNIDEARDQWSHAFARPEQSALIQLANQARFSNRPGVARELIFLSGDIHTGCIFDITLDEPHYTATSLTSSGISTVENRTFAVGILIDDHFAVAPGIHAQLRSVAKEFNFGVVQVTPTGAGATIVVSLAHRGNSFTVGVDVADLL
jgi:hypothetical protein